ncbi:uncharacterized protein LOC143918968 [Arctopsyche grandis]|uniref:uncharacterized protein LOC143918968 n=1 Tax=Arctopsyche grandis TaxID=121162 RepID=UPI00406DA0D6
MKSAVSVLLLSTVYCVAAQGGNLFNVPLGPSSSLFGSSTFDSPNLHNRFGVRSNLFQNDHNRLSAQLHATQTLAHQEKPVYTAGSLLNYQGRGSSGSLAVDKIPSGVQVGAQGGATIWRPNKNSNLDAVGQYSQTFMNGNSGKPFFGAGLKYNF